jgi:long-chain acyl-CoA synthetase
VSLQRQSIEVPGEPGVYGSPLMPDGTFCERFDASINTVYDAFLVGADLSHNGPCLGWRPSKTADYKWKTYNDVMNDALKVGSAFIHLGLKHGLYSMLSLLQL